MTVASPRLILTVESITEEFTNMLIVSACICAVQYLKRGGNQLTPSKTVHFSLETISTPLNYFIIFLGGFSFQRWEPSRGTTCNLLITGTFSFFSYTYSTSRHES